MAAITDSWSSSGRAGRGAAARDMVEFDNIPGYMSMSIPDWVVYVVMLILISILAIIVWQSYKVTAHRCAFTLFRETLGKEAGKSSLRDVYYHPSLTAISNNQFITNKIIISFLFLSYLKQKHKSKRRKVVIKNQTREKSRDIEK